MHTDRRKFLAGAGASALALSFAPDSALAQTGGGSAGDRAVAALCDQVLSGDLLIGPFDATLLGLDVGDRAPLRRLLGPGGKADDLARACHAKAMLEAVRAIDPVGLSEIWQVRREVVEHMLEQRLVPASFDIPDVGSPYRLSQQDGAYASVPDLLNSAHPVESSSDAEAYLARLAAFSGLLREETEAQAEEARRGYLAPGWALDLAAKQIEAQLASAPMDSGMTGSLARRTKEKGIAGDWAARAARLL
ncbi:MAG: DUF885 family protein, partial [Alphaproteobacteria bacterium]|nr:DUF885 family protein [Alphaproteobacteria bacterium]